jgi:hypothetical protein
MTFSMLSMMRLASGAAGEEPARVRPGLLFGDADGGAGGPSSSVLAPQLGQATCLPASSGGNSMCWPQEAQMLLDMAAMKGSLGFGVKV